MSQSDDTHVELDDRADRTCHPGEISPQNSGDIIEDSQPGSGASLTKEETHDEGMRRWLVNGVLGIVLVAVFFGGVGWIMDKDVEKWLAYSAPLFTLAGTILAYYFRSSD